MHHFRILVFGLALSAAAGAGQVEEWPVYGHDPGGMRHSPLADITPQNVSNLKVAWTYRTGDVVDDKMSRVRSSFQATPLMIDGTLFVVTPLNRIIALDPETGAERWKFDPKLNRKGDFGDGFTCRGIAAWRDPQDYKLRLYAATQDGRLVSVWAADGKPVAAFGKNGEVNLAEGIIEKRRGEYHFTSPPAVVRDVVVVGSAINDNNRTDMPSGVVRGFDVRTGELRWAWNPVPKQKDDPAYATWEKDSALKTGAGNAWSIFSVDAARDLVFVPTGSASPDFFGGERLGDNRYANSVVALNGSTGKVVWSFQVVHHDLWDFDVPAQPVLLTLKGRDVVAQATKMGHIFVLDRETGKPVFPVEERPVPQSDVPGERTSPTQPFPTLPPPLSRYSLKPEEAWGLTFWDKRRCRELIAGARNDGIFTPPSLRGSIMTPGNVGGTNWGSLAFDAERGIAVVGDTRMPFFVKLYKREERDLARKQYPDAEFAPMNGTPYIMIRFPLLSPWGLPCSPPPWGMLHGVELATGKVKWSVPLGTPRDLTPLPLWFHWGTPFVAGAMTTAGGVTFIGAALDYYFRAFDTSTGAELWKARIPTSAQAVPMTYRVKPGGKQYVVVAVGGHAKLPVKLADYVIAYTLP
jgi:quinoprotein glucose dehydrogenase